MDNDAEDIVPSSQSSEVIQPINRETVHRICSGQVVLSLAIAVKELVENAIDAGATIMDIRLKEYGSDLIEVCDNGTGVIKENFQALTLQHYTSKIRKFDDLESLSTLGFRGEALSSLCALSDLNILTKHAGAENATKITYNRNGKIISETLSAREQGTTVTLSNLFSTLPVRRKEFMKNLKREFNKMCQLLYAYCLVSKGIKFSCMNVTNNGSKNTVVSTEGLNTVKDNIINVFGPKQISSLIEVEILRPEDPILIEYGLQLVEGEPLPFVFEFFISSAMHGSGRSTNDRQFFYINSRPCEPAKVMKLVNEIYKQYNNQCPFVYLNIQSNSGLIDVNVTPDKRQIFLEKEKILLATLKASLVEAFKSFPSTYKMQNLNLSQSTTIKDFCESKDKISKGLKRSLTDSGLKKGSILDKFKKRSKTENDKESATIHQKKIGSKESDNMSTSRMLATFLKIANTVDSDLQRPTNVPLVKNVESEQTDSKDVEEIKITCGKDESYRDDLQSANKKANSNLTNAQNVPLVKNVESEQADSKDVEEIKITCEKDKSYRDVENIVTIMDQTLKTENKDCKISSADQQTDVEKDEGKIASDESKMERALGESILDEEIEYSIDMSIKNTPKCNSVTLDVTVDGIKELIRKRNKCSESEDIKVRFRSKIEPESNKSAEEELRKQISQQDFAKMKIVGQFNLGFIITSLQNDLFIIDQHATDEKYNFEQLQANTILENQVLVNPKPLQLTAGNECLLIENEQIFKKNGFSFKINESAPCTKKISLTAIPLSKSVVFGKDDIDEMLFMLQDSNYTMCRPSRIRAMFASRACRKSVMIGKSLSKSDMRRLIDHMGEIEQPWNCPHGRPTMRHLLNLDLIHDEKQ